MSKKQDKQNKEAYVYAIFGGIIGGLVVLVIWNLLDYLIDGVMKVLNLMGVGYFLYSFFVFSLGFIACYSWFKK